MAPLPLIPNVYELTTFGSLFGKPCDHVTHWHIEASAGQEGVAAQTLAGLDVTDFVPAFASLLPDGYTHLSSRGVYLGSLTVPEGTANGGAKGNSTVIRVPAQCCITYRHTSPTRGKGKDGRTNLPGPQAAQVSPTDYYSLEPQTVTAYELAWDNYYQAVVNGLTSALNLLNPPALVIASRTHGTYQIPSSTAVDPYLNTHRRWVKRLARHRRA